MTELISPTLPLRVIMMAARLFVNYVPKSFIWLPCAPFAKRGSHAPATDFAALPNFILAKRSTNGSLTG